MGEETGRAEESSKKGEIESAYFERRLARSPINWAGEGKLLPNTNRYHFRINTGRLIQTIYQNQKKFVLRGEIKEKV